MFRIVSGIEIFIESPHCVSIHSYDPDGVGNQNNRTRPSIGDLVVESVMKSYMCVICGLIYDEEKGWPDDGIAAGTRWDDVPLTWKCPECGAGKEDFEMVEV